MQPRRRHLFLALLVATAALLAVPSLASAAGDLTPSPTSLDFGAQDIHNGPSPGSAVVFTNSTGSDLNVSLVSVTGADAGDFPIIGNDCGFVPDTGVCKVALQFDPTTVGPASAQLELVDDNGTVIVPLSGTGATGTLSGSSPSFYPQPYFYGSQTQNANVNNFSSFGVQPGGVSITGPDASYFSVNFNGCNFFLKPSNGCGIGVTFNPGNAPGTRNAQLELSNDGTVDPLVIPLTATALAGPVAQVTPALYDFGAVAVGSVSFSQTFTVINTGDSPLQIQQLLILSGTPQLFPITGDSCSGQFVNPGGACQFTVRFQPSSTG
ncbi:MAG TPA: choice-of-anchor D domain-containing protein, partial [Gemmatimonadales bacterium]|nr:choice-of-anchor D domain-containing protein [Gemmatimonadales bacterium]